MIFSVPKTKAVPEEAVLGEAVPVLAHTRRGVHVTASYLTGSSKKKINKQIVGHRYILISISQTVCVRFIPCDISPQYHYGKLGGRMPTMSTTTPHTSVLHFFQQEKKRKIIFKAKKT